MKTRQYKSHTSTHLRMPPHALGASPHALGASPHALGASPHALGAHCRYKYDLVWTNETFEVIQLGISGYLRSDWVRFLPLKICPRTTPFVSDLVRNTSEIQKDVCF